MPAYSSDHGRLAMASSSFALFCLLIQLASLAFVNGDELRVGYYRRSCPSVEDVVKQTVTKAVARDPGMPAGLIRLHFHDCFVRGCDASVLLDSTPGNPAEKASPTDATLTGFDVIDEAKTLLESQCPQVVSCADIVAFAARDSVQIAGGFYYPVPAGRRDGLVSKQSEVDTNLPRAFFNVQQLQDTFARKGFSVEEMVTLSGAHTIGDSHCSSFSKRLYNFNSTNASDPSMDPKYVSDLKGTCPAPGSSQNPTAPLDPVTPRTLDNQYYVNLQNHKGLLSSDQALMDRADTARMVHANAERGSMWSHKFAEAMVRMGKIEVLAGSQGQIRKSCRVVN